MVLAYHVPLANYGFWLPNDQRGPGSDFVRNKQLLPYGLAKKVTTRRSVARLPFDFEVRRLAREAMKYPPVEFTNEQIRCCGRGIANVVRKTGIVVYACSILPGHSHYVIKRHRYMIEQIIRQLRTGMKEQLLAEGLHPLAQLREADGSVPCCWSRSPWKVFLDNDASILAEIKYVRDNLTKARMPKQDWSFVVPFTGLESELWEYP